MWYLSDMFWNQSRQASNSYDCGRCNDPDATIYHCTKGAVRKPFLAPNMTSLQKLNIIENV